MHRLLHGGGGGEEIMDTRTTTTRRDTARGGRGLSPLSWLAIILVVIGALNWALWGLFEFNLVAAIFGTLTIFSRIIYVLVGIAGLYLLYAAATRYREPRAV
jgi:uncharacterized protein